MGLLNAAARPTRSTRDAADTQRSYRKFEEIKTQVDPWIRMLPRDQVSYSLFQSTEEFKGFRCEKPGYVDFVCKPEEALKHQKENLTVTYVFWDKDRPIGYVALATGSLRKAEMPSEIGKQKPYQHIPCILLGQMARDVNYKRQGVGKIMVDFAISTARQIAEKVGCRYVILDAELDKVELYKGFGFQEVPRGEGGKTCVMYFDLGFREEPQTN